MFNVIDNSHFVKNNIQIACAQLKERFFPYD